MISSNSWGKEEGRWNIAADGICLPRKSLCMLSPSLLGGTEQLPLMGNSEWIPRWLYLLTWFLLYLVGSCSFNPRVLLLSLSWCSLPSYLRRVRCMVLSCLLGLNDNNPLKHLCLEAYRVTRSKTALEWWGLPATASIYTGKWQISVSHASGGNPNH